MKLQRWLLGCLAAVAVGFVHGQTLRWGGQGDVLTLDPMSQNEIFTNSFNGQVYESLVGRNKQLAIVPRLATEWKQIGTLKWTFKLRPSVVFHDGRPFSADDVLFSIRRAQAKTSQISGYAEALGEPRKIDDLTVEFNLRRFNPVFLEHLSAIPIMSKSWCEEHKVTLPQDFMSNEESFTTRHSNGTGPYSVTIRQPDIRTVLRRNESYWSVFEGNVKEVIFTPIPSGATRVAALISGEIDFIADPPPQDISRLRANSALTLFEGIENRVLFVGMDQARDELLYSNVKGKNPFKDQRVRRALYQAIDIEAIHIKLMNGMAAPTGAVAPSPLTTFNDPELERRLPYDLAAARKLMAEAGYANGFEVTLDCPNNRYANDERICVALSDMWARIKVIVSVDAMPKSLYFKKLERLDTSLYLFGWGGAVIDPETLFTPLYRNRGENGVGEYNRGNYKDDVLDELAAATSTEADPDRRKQLIRRVFIRHNDQVHHIPLHRQVITWVARRGVSVVPRADNWLEIQWVRVATSPDMQRLVPP